MLTRCTRNPPSVGTESGSPDFAGGAEGAALAEDVGKGPGPVDVCVSLAVAAFDSGGDDGPRRAVPAF